ncbi:hypothetical protein D3C81_2235270 [compost metagenome]
MVVSCFSLDWRAAIAISVEFVVSFSLLVTSAAFLGVIFSKIAVLLALFITLKICAISSVVKFSMIGAALDAFIPA